VLQQRRWELRARRGRLGTGWQVRPSSFDLDGLADVLLYSATSGVFGQGINGGPGSFSFLAGQWEPGRTIVTGHGAP